MTPMTRKDYLAMSACYGILAGMFALIGTTDGLMGLHNDARRTA